MNERKTRITYTKKSNYYLTLIISSNSLPFLKILARRFNLLQDEKAQRKSTGHPHSRRSPVLIYQLPWPAWQGQRNINPSAISKRPSETINLHQTHWLTAERLDLMWPNMSLHGVILHSTIGLSLNPLDPTWPRVIRLKPNWRHLSSSQIWCSLVRILILYASVCVFVSIWLCVCVYYISDALTH